MIIKCTKTKRILAEINIENYLINIEKLGISLERPLEITLPCKNCKKREVYLIYKDRYIFKKNIDNKKQT